MANFYASYAGSSSISAVTATISSPIGQTTMASSVSVAVASDQSSIPVAEGGTASVNLIRNDYTSVNVTSSAYVQLVAATSAIINKIYVFDSSGAALVIATGAAASEVNKFYVFPGGVSSPVSLNIPSGTRLSIKSIDTATVSTGQLLLTCLG